MFHGRKWDYLKRKIEPPSKNAKRKELYMEAIANLREDHEKRAIETRELIDFLERMAKRC